MPELPEVETVKRGLAPHITSQQINEVIVRETRLRWPVPSDLSNILKNQTIIAVERRAKYLLFNMTDGTLIVHLGMSGCLRLMDYNLRAIAHDHIDIVLNNKLMLRYNDPRRFGAILWTNESPYQHALLNQLGPEPLSNCLTSNHLFLRAQNRKQSIKAFLMDSHIVAGIGNIYAQEILFLSKISPLRQVNNISRNRYEILVENIKLVLKQAIMQGGTTLKDFRNAEGKPGYFSQQLQVYGRANQPCYHCGEKLKSVTQQQRTTVYCVKCQR